MSYDCCAECCGKIQAVMGNVRVTNKDVKPQLDVRDLRAVRQQRTRNFPVTLIIKAKCA